MKTWDTLDASKMAKLAYNPVRSFVENDVTRINKEIADQGPPAGRPSALINISIGDPTIYHDFMTNEINLEILARQIGKHDGYTDFAGMLEARKYLAEIESKKAKHIITENDVFITFGGSLALWIATNCLTDPGDNILSPNPGFQMVKSIASKREVNVKEYKLIAEKNWQMDIEHAESLIDERTKFILINNPSNPLGTVWSKEHMLDIIKLAEKHGLPIVADEIYENIIFPGEQNFSFTELSEKVPILKCGGTAKEFYAPGWRIGWVVLSGPEGVFDEVKKGIQNLVSMIFHPNTVVMSGLKEIIDSNHEVNMQRSKTLKERYELLKEKIKDIKGLWISDTRGAMYAAINIRLELFKDIKSDRDFALMLYKEQNVMTLPGSCFGSVGSFFRIIICFDSSVAEEIAKRLNKFCEDHYL